MSSLFNDEGESGEKTQHDLSRLTEIVTRILTHLGVESVYRGYIDAVIGAANGSTRWFECFDIVMAKRLRPERAGELTDDALKKYLQRMRNDFHAHQSSLKVNLIEAHQGGMVNGEKHGYSYRVPLLGLAAEVAERAARPDIYAFERRLDARAHEALTDIDQDILTDPDRVEEIIKEAIEVRLREPRSPGMIRRNRRSGNKLSLEARRGYVLAYARKVIALAEARGIDRGDEIDALAAAILALKDVDGTTTMTAEPAKAKDEGIDKGGQSHPPSIFVHVDEAQKEVDKKAVEEEAQGGEMSLLPAVMNEHNSKLAARDNNYSDISIDAAARIAPPELLKDSETEFLRAIAAFETIGCRRFLVGLKDDAALAANQSDHYVQKGKFDSRDHKLLNILRESVARQRSCILTPQGSELIHLDDCDPDEMELLRPHAFAVFQTSHDSYHCWLALTDADAGSVDDITVRLFARLGKGCKANRACGRSCRWPGSRNYKHADAPVVRLTYTAAHVTNERELLAAGIIAEPMSSPQVTTPPVLTARPFATAAIKKPIRFPDYAQVLTSVPTVQSGPRAGQADTSKADYRWSYIALEWGWAESEVACQLPLVSERAPSKGNRYIRRTVGAALKDLERQ